MTANEWIALLIAQGPALREAGVTSLQFDGMGATLTPAAPKLDSTVGDKGHMVDDANVDPLNNPALYPGGVVPGYEFHPETEDDQ